MKFTFSSLLFVALFLIGTVCASSDPIIELGLMTDVVSSPQPTATATAAPSPSHSPLPPVPEPSNEEWKTAVALTIAGVVGVTFLLFGYRLFRVTIAVVVLATIGLISYYIIEEKIDASQLTSVLVSVGIGLIVAVLSFIFWKIAVPFIGMLLGIGLTAIIISSPAASDLSSDGAVYGLLVPFMLILAVVSYIFARFFIILVTCALGSLGLVSIIDHFVASGFTEGFYGGIGRIFQTHSFFGLYISYDSMGWEGPDDSKLHAYLLLGSFVIIAAIGAAIQVFYTARGFHHEGKKSSGSTDPERTALLLTPERSNGSPYSSLRNETSVNHATTRNTVARKWGLDKSESY